MQRQPGSSRVISAGRIDEEELRSRAQCSHRSLTERPLTQRQVAGGIRRAGFAGDHDGVDAAALFGDRGRGPGGLTCATGTGAATREDDEDSGGAQRAAARQSPGFDA